MSLGRSPAISATNRRTLILIAFVAGHNMEEKRPFDKTLIFAVFSFSTLVFIAGILLGNYFATYRLSDLRQLKEDLEINRLDVVLETELFEKSICDFNFKDISKERTALGSQVDYMESKRGSDDEEVILLKKKYFLHEIRLLFLVKQLILDCKKDYIPILFFYSNKENKTISQDQGYILDYFFKNHQDEIVIFSFDINYQSPSTYASLKRIYNVKFAPTIVFNETKYEGFLSIEELEKIYEKTK